MNGILGSLGIDPFYLFIFLFILQVVLIVLLIILNNKYRYLQKSYTTFMKGRNGKDRKSTRLNSSH